jgi:hypothetical protein
VVLVCSLGVLVLSAVWVEYSFLGLVGRPSYL